jgi:hypothetical protein
MVVFSDCFDEAGGERREHDVTDRPAIDLPNENVFGSEHHEASDAPVESLNMRFLLWPRLFCDFDDDSAALKRRPDTIILILGA